MANKKSTPSTFVGDPVRVPKWAIEDWETARLRVQSLPTAQWLWDRILTGEERHQLKGDLKSAYTVFGGPAQMWMRLHGVSFARAVVEVATRCQLLDSVSGQALLRELGETSDDPEKAIELAVSAGGLVLTESPREAWWNGNLIDIDWMVKNREWQLLCELARQAKAGGVVDRFLLYGADTDDIGYLKKLKRRLIAIEDFPASLAKVIQAAGRGTYQLRVATEKIRLYTRGTGDSLREWIP